MIDPTNLSTLRLSLLADLGTKAPGAIIVENAVYVEYPMSGADAIRPDGSMARPDFVATFADAAAARAALAAAGWWPMPDSKIAFFPVSRELATASKTSKSNTGVCHSARRNWDIEYSWEGMTEGMTD